MSRKYGVKVEQNWKMFRKFEITVGKCKDGNQRLSSQTDTNYNISTDLGSPNTN
jgi:hypothetical protein